MTPPTWRPATRGVCVTGMHRSGTSFTMRTLQLLGIDLGSDDTLMPPGPDNRAGYWENRLIKEFDDELLAELGGAWDQPPTLEEGWADDPALDPWRTRASEILDTSFGPEDRGGMIGFKDPRLSILLPFWRTVVDVTTTIIVVRDPREVAASLATRNRLHPSHAALLWLRYVLAAAANDPGHLLLTHSGFFADVDGSIDRVVAHLGLAPADADARAAIRAHLDPSLRHHVADGSAAGHDPVTRLALAVWNGGHPDLGALDPVVAAAISAGWLRAPADGEALTRARADAVRFKEHLRARNEQVRALTAELERLRDPGEEPPSGEPSAGSTGAGSGHHATEDLPAT